MTQILYSPASPYSAKVRMAAHYAGVPFESVVVNTSAEPENLITANPLGKIPTLVTDDGKAVFDSRAITQYLNRVSGNKLFPRNAEKRTDAERYEAIADGLADVLLAHVYERRMRPEEKIHQPWLDLQWRKAERALDLLNEAPPRLAGKLHAGHIAVAATLGYLALRFDGKWERGRPKLKRWVKRFQELHPELTALLPQG
ncbi:glutathione S-transferase [Ochrobactrum sp. GPK 3]|jgi:glutathione S-transferase|uniref:glutathione S-transferase n=1 Tax=Brucella TaxID=234 RepID=UPI00110DE600|nr:glutathione S-transferase [Brucella haematophila]KAB2698059.1 glutathione S-transferase [Ochrobactrum sp. Kaboul]TMV01607.1 glutathione S-transferase [Brucella haematophila]